MSESATHLDAYFHSSTVGFPFLFDFFHIHCLYLVTELQNVFICCFSDLSSEINRFEISLSNKTKKSKESDICKYICAGSKQMYSLYVSTFTQCLLVWCHNSHVSHLFYLTSRLNFSPSVFMRCQLNRLQKGQMIDEWFPLSSHVPLKGIEPGSLRVRARYSMEKIMPEEEYSEFKEVCLDCPFTFCRTVIHFE